METLSWKSTHEIYEILVYWAETHQPASLVSQGLSSVLFKENQECVSLEPTEFNFGELPPTLPPSHVSGSQTGSSFMPLHPSLFPFDANEGNEDTEPVKGNPGILWTSQRAGSRTYTREENNKEKLRKR